MGPDPGGVIGDILAEHVILNSRTILFQPAAYRTINIVDHDKDARRRRDRTYLAIVSDHPSPIPPASVVCKQRPVPPPVMRLVIPCVFSWLTISFSRAPSRWGYGSRQSCSFSSTRKMEDMHTEVSVQRNILIRPDWPLNSNRLASAHIHKHEYQEKRPTQPASQSPHYLSPPHPAH